MANMSMIAAQKNLAHCSCHKKTDQNYKADLL